VCALQPRREGLDSQFLHEWIRYVRPEWMKLAGGNRKDPNINKSIVEAMTLPLPPLAVQVEFRSRLCAQLAEARAIVDAATRRLTEIELLPSRLLAQAFGSSTS
jgi:type I restriction enzyme S subunit